MNDELIALLTRSLRLIRMHREECLEGKSNRRIFDCASCLKGGSGFCEYLEIDADLNDYLNKLKNGANKDNNEDCETQGCVNS